MFDICNDFDTLFACLEVQSVVLTEYWLGQALKFARYLFYSLFLLELIVTGYIALQRRGKWDELLQQIATKMIILGVIMVLLIAVDSGGLSTISPIPIVQIPETVARESAAFVAGKQEITTTPGHILVKGKSLAGEFLKLAFQSNQEINIFSLNFSILITLVLAPLIWLGTVGVFIRLAVEYLQVTIETYFAVAAGAVTVGLLAFRGTASISSGWIRYIVSLLLRLFFLLMVILFALELANGLLNAMQQITASPPRNFVHSLQGSMPFQLTFAAAMLMIHFLIKLPDKLSQQLTANLSIDVAGMLKRL